MATKIGSKRYNSPWLMQLAKYFKAANINGKQTYEQAAADRALTKFGEYDKATKGLVIPTDADALKAYNNAKDVYTSYGDISDDVSLGQLGGLAMGAMQNHPLETIGLTGLGAANIGGLTDNDKFGGQLAGLIGGGVLSSQMLGGHPFLGAAATMGAGELGALFDKLRAKKEAERQAQQGQYPVRR